MRDKLLVILVASVLLAATGALAYTSGVPTGLTGAPGEDTCANCHDNLNTGPGGATITAPGTYSAGETIEVLVDVFHAGQEKWGLEITALDDSNQPVGQFVITDAVRTQLDVDGGTELAVVFGAGLEMFPPKSVYGFDVVEEHLADGWRWWYAIHNHTIQRNGERLVSKRLSRVSRRCFSTRSMRRIPVRPGSSRRAAG